MKFNPEFVRDCLTEGKLEYSLSQTNIDAFNYKEGFTIFMNQVFETIAADWDRYFSPDEEIEIRGIICPIARDFIKRRFE